MILVLPFGYKLVVVDNEVRRFIQVRNEKSEDDINGKEKVNDEINGHQSSFSCYFESQLEQRCPR